ncbi:MAG: DUF362 domain-containing protein [Bilifractor sp.]|jgi:uncharacterized protein (DUF362 family)
MRENQIWKIYGTEFLEMTKTLLGSAGLADRIGDRNLRICVKPNLVSPTPADFGATTHPEIAAGIIEYLQENGFDHILMAEGSWVGDRTSDAYEYCGYREISEKYGVPFIDTKKRKSHPADCCGMELNVTDVVDEFDFLINVPVLKGHCQTKMTCALKNLKGLLPDSEKRRFHKMGLHDPIAHLSGGIHQDFIVIDHICGDPEIEDGGNPLVKNCIMAATDPVLADSYACYLLGIKPGDVAYVTEAGKLGIGSTDLSHAQIVTITGPDGTYRISRPEDDRDESPVGEQHRVLDVSYAVDEVESCSACYGNLVPALLRLKEEGLLERLQDRIAIGQGQQGQTGKLGVGKCTRNFDFCVMGCPPDEEKIYRELRSYIENQTG